MRDKYKIIFLGRSEQAIADGATLRWPIETKTAILKHAVHNDYCAFALPSPKTLIRLCIEIGLPLDRGAELAETCITKLISWIKNNLNDKLVSSSAAMHNHDAVRHKVHVSQALVDMVEKEKFSYEWLRGGRVGERHANSMHTYKTIKNVVAISPARLVRETISYAVERDAITDDGHKKDMVKVARAVSPVCVSTEEEEEEEWGSEEEKASSGEEAVKKSKKGKKRTTGKKGKKGKGGKKGKEGKEGRKCKLVVKESSEDEESSAEEPVVVKGKAKKKTHRASAPFLQLPAALSSAEDSSSQDEPVVVKEKKPKKKHRAGLCTSTPLLGKSRIKAQMPTPGATTEEDSSEEEEEPVVEKVKESKKNKRQTATSSVDPLAPASSGESQITTEMVPSPSEQTTIITKSSADPRTPLTLGKLAANLTTASTPLTPPGPGSALTPTTTSEVQSYYSPTTGRLTLSALSGALDSEVTKTNLLAELAQFSAGGVDVLRGVGMAEGKIQEVLRRKILEGMSGGVVAAAPAAGIAVAPDVSALVAVGAAAVAEAGPGGEGR